MPRHIALADTPSLLQPGQQVYLPGSSGTAQAFVDILLEDPDHSRGLHLTTSCIPGINRLPLERLADDAVVSGMFMQADFADAQRAGRFRMLPASYAGFVRQVCDGPAFDLAVLQLSPPDAQGRCSLGALAEFTPAVLENCRHVLGIINPNVPQIAGAATVYQAQLDWISEADSPLATYAVRDDDSAQRIAAHVASLIEDGSSVQMGLGAVPNALYQALRGHRRLRLHSGMFSDGLIDLHAAGALDPDFSPTTCALVGSRAFYDHCQRLPGLRVLGCQHTHDPRTLLSLQRFTAVNSALEVDLFGQCNLEHAAGRAVSGAGGAPDFARAARLSPGGRSIVALNATHGRHAVSRIVPLLGTGAVASLARCDIDCVVTEYGIARLQGASVHERAQALIAIAAPQHRDDLALAWAQIADNL